MNRMGFGNTAGGASISSLNWDKDLEVPAIYKIKVDHIAEKTAAAGVTLDNAVNAALVKADHIAELTGAHGIVLDSKPTGVIRTVVASENLKQSQDTETSAIYANWFGAAVYIFQIPAACAGGGTVRIKSDLRGTVAGSIYKHLFARGVFAPISTYPTTGAYGQADTVTKTVTVSYATYADDFTIPAGVTTLVVIFQNYLYGSDTAYAKNVRLCYDVV